MNIVRKFFSLRSPRKICVRAYELFLEELTVDQIVEKMCAEGFSKKNAARAVTFMPSAFARVHYEKKGIGFPLRFYPGRKAHEKGIMRLYSKEPIFCESMRLAEQLKRDGDWSQVWRFIEISAEHKGITKAKGDGLTPTCISTSICEF